MRALASLTAVILGQLLVGCTTIVIPLKGTHVMRPRAGLADAGARISVGAMTEPVVEGTIEEIKAADGTIINPLPGEFDSSGKKVEAVVPDMPVELAVDWSERYEFGLSSARGLFFMWDYAVWQNAALTLTPSYASASVEGGDPQTATTVDANGQETTEVTHGYEGESSNLNVTQLASVFAGNLKWAAVFLYGGFGLNSFSAKILDKESKEEFEASQVAPTVLAGVHFRLAIFELTFESASTMIKYRDGTKASVPTEAATFSMHIAL